MLAGELALADSRLQQALADVQLYKALGGGFASFPTGARGGVSMPSGTAMTSMAQGTAR